MKNILLITFVFMLSACSAGYSSSTQVDDKAYLQLAGDLSNTVLIINDQQPIMLDSGEVNTFKLNGEKVAKFDLPAGSHTVEVLRNNTTVVKRKIYVSNGNTFEVRVEVFYYLLPILTKQKLNQLIVEEVKLIDELLIFLINPLGHNYSKKDLCLFFQYPNIDLEELDLDWI